MRYCDSTKYVGVMNKQGKSMKTEISHGWLNNFITFDRRAEEIWSS